MKIYKKGNYIYLINASGDIKQDHANEVKITKTNVANETYSIYSDDLGVNYVTFSELTQENGTAYASISAWELWYAENTGFNPASGGSGAGTVINTVSNFASLPDATLVSNGFYWVSSATGYRIIGTYKSNGLYYSNGTSWEYIDAPTTATQSEVNDGTLTDKYLTPSTFENASKWVNYLDKATYDTDNDGIVDSAKKEVVQFINKSGATITKGTIVYLKSTSSSANYPEVLKANATTENTSSKTIGAVFEDVLNDGIGYIVTSGEVRNLDTSAYAIGTKLWLSTTDGLVTTTAPIQPNHTVFIGTVTRSQLTKGRILYAIQNGYELNELHNVKIDNGTLANNDIIAYNSTTLLWENVPNAPVTTTLNLTDSTDKRFVTDTEKTKLTNTTNTNSGDETNGTIKTKLGVASGSNDGYLSSSDYTTFASAGSPFIPELPITSYPQGYYANNGSATLSILGNVSSAALSGTASLNSIVGTNTLTRTVRISIPTSSTVGSKAGVRTASLRHSVGQGFLFSVCWMIQDASYVAGAKQFHGLLPISTLSTINNLINVESLMNFVGVGSDASNLNLQIFHSANGVTSKIDLGADFPANRTAGAVMNNVYVFEMYNEPNTTTVKYRITERSSGNTAQGEITTDLPTADILLASQSIRTNGATALATITQWQHLIGYIL